MCNHVQTDRKTQIAYLEHFDERKAAFLKSFNVEKVLVMAIDMSF